MRGIDITAAINNPVETLRGRPTISGRKIAKYLESTKPMDDLEENTYLDMSATRTQTRGELSGAEDVDPNQTTVLDRDRTVQPGNGQEGATSGVNMFFGKEYHGEVRYRDGVPQYGHPVDRLAYALARYHDVGFPLPLEALAELEFIDELYWVMGVSSLQELA